MDTNETQIKTLIEKWVEAVRNKNLEEILAHHSDDIVMFDVPGPFQSIGIDEYRKTWDLFFSCTMQGMFDIQTLKIFADDTIAFAIAIMKCSDKSDTPDFVELPFRLTIGLKKIKSQWTVIHEHHSIPSK